jgi:Transposase DDE domain group 1
VFVFNATPTPPPSTKKVRRDSIGGKRGDGHRRCQRIRRPDPRNIRIGVPDAGLTAYGGLAGFGAFLRDLGVDESLRYRFGRLKPGFMVVYPMQTQMRLLMDAAAVGEPRIFGVEALSADPLFVHLAGGVVPSLDTVYRDLRRFDDEAIADLEQMMADHGLAPVRAKRRPLVHLDVDTTVEPVFGTHEGALPGPNPRYHGRPSYHPILARCAETDTVVGAMLRPGDTGFGEADAPTIAAWIDRLREATGPDTVIRTRIDAAGDHQGHAHRRRAQGVLPNQSQDHRRLVYRDPPCAARLLAHRRRRRRRQTHPPGSRGGLRTR